jgi:hypothetical protein
MFCAMHAPHRPRLHQNNAIIYEDDPGLGVALYAVNGEAGPELVEADGPVARACRRNWAPMPRMQAGRMEVPRRWRMSQGDRLAKRAALGQASGAGLAGGRTGRT